MLPASAHPMPSLDDSGSPAAAAESQIAAVLQDMDTGDADYEDMDRALRNAQKSIAALRAENSKLKADLSNMILAKAAKASGRRTPAPSSAGPSRAGTPRSGTPRADTPSAQISEAPDESDGPPSGDEMRARKPAFGHDKTSRIGRNPNEVLAAEIYDCLPIILHPFVTTVKTFRIEFYKAVNAKRSNTLGRIRSFVAHLWGIPVQENNVDVFTLKNNIARSTVPRICELIGRFTDPVTGVVKYEALPPFLYKDEDTSRRTGLFLNAKFIQTIAKIIVGPNASQARSNNTVLRTDRPNETTIGLICTVYIYLLYTFSDDNAFSAKGEGRDFDYKVRAEECKKMLIEGKRDLPIWFSTVMETINTKLFKNATPAVANEEEIDIGDDNRLNQIFKQMQIEERALAEARRNGDQLLDDGDAQQIDNPDNNVNNDESDDDIYMPEVHEPLNIPPEPQQVQVHPPAAPQEPPLPPNPPAPPDQPETSGDTQNTSIAELDNTPVPVPRPRGTRGGGTRASPAVATQRAVPRITRSNAGKGPQ